MPTEMVQLDFSINQTWFVKISSTFKNLILVLKDVALTPTVAYPRNSFYIISNENIEIVYMKEMGYVYIQLVTILDWQALSY